MSEMVELVAKAMAESEGDYTVTDHWRRRAAVAIAAMAWADRRAGTGNGK